VVAAAKQLLIENVRIISRMSKSANRPWVTRKDLRRLLAIALVYLGTSLWPRRGDGWLMRWRLGVFFRLRRNKVRRLAAGMRQVIGSGPSDQDLLRAAGDHFRMSKEIGWIRIRNLHASGDQTQIEIRGLDHLERGLAAGHGLILWGMLFCGYTVAKAALSRAGIRVAHLSREDHAAPSQSWVGLRVVAPILWRAETRYLDRRVVIPMDGTRGHMQELLDLLGSNACVSITGELKGKRNQEARLFSWTEEFATGAPWLAWKMHSTLLTYYVIRTGSFQYRLVIEPPIEPDRAMDGPEFIKSAVEEFASRLQRNILDHPGDWDRWMDADIERRF
jgi:lauroyl/myristoyl acyltransferase